MQNNETKDAEERLYKLFLSPDNIIKRAKKYSEKSSFPEAEKEIPYYYFILKNFIAEHESRFGTIPIQIHNEHRMTLDHLIRAKANNYEGHTNNAIGHLRRALLDIAKLNCAGLRKKIDKRQATIPKKALGLISNGDYIKGYIKMQNEAENLLNKARSEDHKIGNVVEINEDIVNLFVEAYVAHCAWYKFQAENMGNALFIKAKYYILIGFPLVISFLLGLTVNFIYDCLK